MANPIQPLTEEQIATTIEAMKRHDRGDGTYHTAAMGEELGIGASTVRGRIRRIKQMAAQPEHGAEPQPHSTAATRRETRDADFWRRRASALQSSLADAEALAEQLAGVRGQSIAVPGWLLSADRGERSKSVVGLLLTDVHAGEVIARDELLGINGYDVEICRTRLRRYFAAACSIPQRWTSDTDNQGALLALGGDLVSGDIHDELRITGLAGSGKTTAARRLIDVHGFTRHRMAGPLKAMLHCLGLDDRHTDGELKEAPCDLLGGRTPRHAMQTLGTEWGRSLIGPDLWVKAWRATLPAGHVVVDDIRFANEADVVREAGGIVARIDRPGLAAGGHESERLSSDVDHVIVNDGPLAQLYHEVDRLAPLPPAEGDFRYVPIPRIPSMLETGWVVADDMHGCHHGEYAVLMREG